jgi:MarR family transcriptional regulator for hemolysin
MDRLRNFGFLLKSVSRLSSKNFEHYARELDLDLTECKVLVHLARNEGVSQARLAELSDTAPMTLVRSLDRMETDHWIERRPDPGDRRAHRLYLTDKAHSLLERIWRIADHAREQAFAGISNADRNRLLDLLEQVHANLAALEPGPATAKPEER